MQHPTLYDLIILILLSSAIIFAAFVFLKTIYEIWRYSVYPGILCVIDFVVNTLNGLFKIVLYFADVLQTKAAVWYTDRKKS